MILSKLTVPSFNEKSVSSFSLGPATFANNLSPKITSSDKTPSLINVQSLPAAVAPFDSLCELFVPHSSSATQIYAFPILHLLAPGGGSYTGKYTCPLNNVGGADALR